MKSAQTQSTGKPGCKLLVLGILLGLLTSFIVLVLIALQWGPRGESMQVDLYSGRLFIDKHFLWKRSHIYSPMSKSAQWAIDNQDPVRNWYVFVASEGRSHWFSSILCADTITREYASVIYSLPLPEAKRIQLLHQYHQDLDEVQLKIKELAKKDKIMESFYEKWDQQIEKLNNDS